MSSKKMPALTEQDIHQFLPAAIEIEQSPAPKFGRSILWAIITLFVIALVWSYFGKVDIVAVAQGKVIPSERVKQIQPLEAAIVSEIHVKEGSFVNKDDPLITLDPTMAVADVNQIDSEWRDAVAQQARVDAFIGWLRSATGEMPTLKGDSRTDPSQLEKQNKLLKQEVLEYQAKIESIVQETERLKAELEATEAEVDKQSRLLPVIKERVEALEILYRKEYVAKVQYLELKQQLIENEQNLAIQIARLKTLKAAILTNKAQLSALKHEQLKNVHTQRNDLDVKIATLYEQKNKAEKRATQYNLKAPISGYVQQLAMNTIGGVVTPAQVLMEIVPEESVLEVEAFVLNKDIGFVQEGQKAEIKIEAFNFTKYGVMHANVAHLSEDAISDDELGLVYRALLRLDSEKIDIDERKIRLSPGMAVFAEVKTGKRRIIEYVVSPLQKYNSESIRER
ncbi:Type I secretion membrane fusion protein (Hemolysin secretion protein D) [gamma proteobacterium HdN1]|nr:Type I secretion membrane fusion protein (Hemolysin secretion protein D) [gamma proteobacterium HdN1]